MKHALIFGICLIFCAAVAFAGCTGTSPGTPAGQIPVSETPVQVNHIVVTEQQNTATVNVSKGGIITVKLADNPTTGYSWNLTVTPGLSITNTSFIPDPQPTGELRLMGAGGTHVWDISTVATGEQKIRAVYSRPWEATTGNETTFSMTIIVAPA